MRCPHLLDWTVSSCKADKKPYVPSIYELQEYCTVREHQRCPLYVDVDRDEEESSAEAREDWSLSVQMD